MNVKRNGKIGLAVVAGGMALALWTAGCEGDSLYEGVAVYPASVELRVGQSMMFVASGGQEYEWSFAPVDGRLGLNTAVGDTVVVTALSNEAGGEASGDEEADGEETGETVIALTCRSIIAGVTYEASNRFENSATAYISIR